MTAGMSVGMSTVANDREMVDREMIADESDASCKRLTANFQQLIARQLDS